MENKRRDNKFLIAVAALVLVGVSLGYALISRTYQFLGTTNVGGNNWNIEIPDPGDIGVNPPEAPAPSVVEDPDTGIVKITYTADLEKPGDFYEFVTPIKNSGSIEAELASVTIDPNLSAAQQEYLTYTVVDADTNQPLAVGQKLAAETGVIKVKVRVQYRNDDEVDTTKYPSEAVNGIKLGCELKFVQDTN